MRHRETLKTIRPEVDDVLLISKQRTVKYYTEIYVRANLLDSHVANSEI